MKGYIKKNQKKREAKKALKRNILNTAINRCNKRIKENSYLPNQKLIKLAKTNKVNLGSMESKLIADSNY